MNNSREKSEFLKFAIGLVCMILGVGGLSATLCGVGIAVKTGVGLDFVSQGSFDYFSWLVLGSIVGGALVTWLAFIWSRSIFLKPARGFGLTFDDSDKSSTVETQAHERPPV